MKGAPFNRVTVRGPLFIHSINGDILGPEGHPIFCPSNLEDVSNRIIFALECAVELGRKLEREDARRKQAGVEKRKETTQEASAAAGGDA